VWRTTGPRRAPCELRDELEARVRERTAELERANALLVDEIAQRAEAERRLAQAHKLEAVGRLAGGIAHDFNNLLGVILGRSSMVQSRLTEGEPFYDDMEAIRSACRHGASLTRHLMAFSRREPAVARPLDLNELVRSCARGPLTVIGEDIELVVELDDGLACVLGDHAQLEQVLVNLAVNARDAMPGGGSLTIRTTRLEIAEAAVTTGPLPAGAYAVLSVSDTGVGMDAETQSRIFDPFFSTKPHGTGLGLSTVYGIVRQSAGGIAVASAPGHGTTFRVYLPSSDLAPDDHPDSRARLPVARGSAKVLVVEDQDDLRDTIEETLVAAGYQVVAVGDPVKALALVEHGDLEVDLVVTDLVMPKLGGRELAARVRVMRPRVSILYMSGYDRDEDAEPPASDGAPAGALLAKPFSIESLTAAIHATLERAG
jgi:signal transduction histidine kinase/ActR/RegA family two-component response regulator